MSHASSENRWCSGPSAEESAWKTKKAKKEPVSDPVAKVLIQDGWTVPFVQTFEDFRMAETGFCLATRSEAEEAIRELRSVKGLAILTTKQVKDGSNSKSRRPRACHQCGNDTWCSWELLPSCTSVRQPEVGLWRPTLWSTSSRSTVIPMRGPRP